MLNSCITYKWTVLLVYKASATNVCATGDSGWPSSQKTRLALASATKVGERDLLSVLAEIS